jgi:tubulin polyglutamylase TTLL6/13
MHAYIAFEGMARFCTEDYKKPKMKTQDKDEAKESDDNDNLTNFCLNRKSEKYVTNNDFENNENDGNKRLLSSIFRQLENAGVDVDEIKDDIKDICTKVVLSLQPFLVNSFHSDMGVGSESNQN